MRGTSAAHLQHAIAIALAIAIAIVPVTASVNADVAAAAVAAHDPPTTTQRLLSGLLRTRTLLMKTTRQMRTAQNGTHTAMTDGCR